MRTIIVLLALQVTIALASCPHIQPNGILTSEKSPDCDQQATVDATGYWMKGDIANGAMCLDGTAGLYYHRPGTGSGANKWYIHHEGGGWCTSFEDCYGRSKTNLGTSNGYPAQVDLNANGGYFSSDPSINPLMYNWNSVFLHYCDGASFSGENYTTTIFNNTQLYFRGRLVLHAILNDLLNNRGIDQSTEVVISGCSAGGLSTYLHVDWWHANLPRTARVTGMPDSGFFFDLDTKSADYHTQMHWVFNTQNCTAGVNALCISKNHNDLAKCFFAEHTAPWIVTPLFPLQPKYDYWQLYNVLGSLDVAPVNQFGDHGSKIIHRTFLKSQVPHGIFFDSCTHHCGACWGWKACPTLHIKQVSQLQAHQTWYSGGQKLFIDDQPYNCTTCCS